jgi:nitrite reductase/ring-hydroxylating ferredoxin subunit/uncharacterized membrane protein
MAQRLAQALDSLASRIESTPALDGLANSLVKLGAPLQRPGIRDVLSGTPVGHPAHPVLVTVPIGAWTTASVLDLTFRNQRAARVAVGFGVLSAIPTALTGFSDWLYTTGAERRIGLVHALTNDVALTLYSASWIARRRKRNLRGAALAGVGALVLTAGGWLGGHLAYALGVGVDTTAFQAATEEWTDVLPESELPAVGETTQAEVAGIPLLVVRQADGIHVLADRCTHRGAPLSDGELQAGCIVCPWHDSAFDVQDGSVVRGPASRPQPVYEVRTIGGQLQVRRSAEQRSMRTNPVGV